MVVNFLLVAAGLAVLVVAGDFLVRGAVNLSLRLGIPASIIGMTVVAFGTSAPELVVSVRAVLDGLPGLALGNVVGSNIANILLVLGIPALIAAMPVSREECLRDYVGMIAASVLFIALAFLGPFTWWHGLVLLAGLALMLGDNYRRAQAHRSGVGGGQEVGEDLEGADPAAPGWRIGLFLVAGVMGLPLGAHMLVAGASALASELGVSDALIGLTLVAVGTSLPELATTVMAAIRREAGVAMGNIIGSNLFNLLAIIGVAALVGPMAVPEAMLRLDLWVMLGTSLLIAPFVLRGLPVTRMVGVGFLLAYAAYVAVLFSGVGA